MQRAARVGSHITVRAVISDALVNVAPIRCNVHLAEEDVETVDVEVEDNAGEREERGVNICKFGRFQNSSDSVTCNLEQVTEGP